MLLWPRGAGAALGTALAEAFRTSAAYLASAIGCLTGREAASAQLGGQASAAGARLDDALRQYLAEKGTKLVSLESVAALANGATRLRLAGMAIADLPATATTANAATGAVGSRPNGADDDRLAQPIQVLAHRAQEVTSWYAALADGFLDGQAPPQPQASGESFLQVVLPAVDRCGDAELAARAEQLLWSGQYLGDVTQLRSHLIEPAGQVVAAGARPWWRR
ncbi:MAG: hypothetical protein ACR2N4_01065 [Jatrophihabitans sp.]